MICPLCGCQQREADLCVQCQAPLSVASDQEKSDATLTHATPETSLPKNTEYKVHHRENPILPKKTPTIQRKSINILITTTQRIEGKRIRSYLGLIHANQVIESNQASDQPSSIMKKSQIQIRLKEGTLKVLQELKREAEQLGANAVVACTLNYQQIAQHDVLLTATGTAVQVEAHQ